MDKVVCWVGGPFFSAALEQFGWKVVWKKPQAGEVLYWSEIVELVGHAPDVVVVGDTSCPPFVLGVEDFPCPTVLYAVDTHIHSWLPWYGQAFDLCLVSLKDHVPRFKEQGRLPGSVLWSPPYAPETCEQFPLYSPLELVQRRVEKEFDCLFVGTVNATTPARQEFLRSLKDLLPGLRVQRGNFRQLYPKARVVVNFCEQDDLNFRVFEAMGCGAALVTPDLGQGQAELFQAGRHMSTYELREQPENPVQPLFAARQAAKAIIALLEAPGLCLTQAQAGWEEVDKHHRATHRARALAASMEGLGQHVAERRQRAKSIREHSLKLVYLHWAESLQGAEWENLRAAYVRAALGLPHG